MSRLSREQLEARCNLLESQIRSMDKRVREMWRENCDLRALACFLDDERIAARDLAREMVCLIVIYHHLIVLIIFQRVKILEVNGCQ